MNKILDEINKALQVLPLKLQNGEILKDEDIEVLLLTSLIEEEINGN